MTPPLRVENLHKAYSGIQAVAGVSFTLATREILALIGPNGAGKSTCFNMLTGQVRPDRGTIHLAGQNTTRLGPRRIWQLGVGRTFQVTATFASMTTLENVQVALSLRVRPCTNPLGRLERLDRDGAKDLLELVGLSGHADRPSAELAYGELKRLELAVVLASAPGILLMDEPTAGIAQAERLVLMRTVMGIARSRGLAMLFTEHDMDIVFEHADRVLVLDRGKVIAAGPPAAVRNDARVREVYLGSGGMDGVLPDA